jgi:hypothetical protein
MAEKYEYKCTECNFDFYICDGGAKSCSISTYFCYECMISSMHTTPYNNIYAAPNSYTHYFKPLTKQSPSNSKVLLQQLSSHLKDNSIEMPVFFKEAHQDYLHDLKVHNEFIELLPKEELLAYEESKIPKCRKCKTDEVVMLEDKFCPKCWAMKLKVTSKSLID